MPLNKIYYEIKLFLYTVMIVMGLCACGSDESSDAPLPPSSTKEITVYLSMGGDLIENDDIIPLLVHSTSTNLYGIQIYVYSEQSQNYVPYAAGVFDRLNDLSFTAIEGNRYKIIATSVVDGKQLIKNEIREGLDYFYEPFNAKLTNKFENSEAELSGLKKSLTRMSEQVYSLPAIDRFYGEVTDVTFSETNVGVLILMKRVVFGISYNLKNLQEGSILVSLEDKEVVSPESELTKDQQIIYTFNRMYEAWRGADARFSQVYTVIVKHKALDGSIMLIGAKDIRAERKKAVSLTINISRDKPFLDLDFEGGELEPGEEIIL